MIFQKPLIDGASSDMKKGLNKEYRLWYDYAIICDCVIFFLYQYILRFRQKYHKLNIFSKELAWLK